MKRIVYIILGPTSSGKTALAIKLSKKFDGEIISADSRQIYKGMNIGTGKTPMNSNVAVQNLVNYWTFDDVTVWGYDLVAPDKYFSAYDYASWALPKAREVLEEGRRVFLVGGTGFYVDLFTGSSKPSEVPPDFELRKELEAMDLSVLQEKLTSLNPKVFKKIDQSNPARLIRAIEIELSEGHSPTPLPYLKDVEFVFVGLTASREYLYSRVDTWLDNIWGGGLIEETKKLIKEGYGATRPLNGLVYRSARAFIDGEVSEDETKQQAKYDLHAYIRRQQTYFKKNKKITWFDIENPTFGQQIANHVQSK